MVQLLCWLLLAGGGTAFHGDSARRAVMLLEGRYHAPRTLAASFLQRYFENGKLVRVESGEAYFRRPGKMRWQYQAPEKNLFLVDGKTAWFYVPADHTVTRVPAKDSTDWRTPIAWLAGELKLSRFCARIDVVSGETLEKENDVILDCVLKDSETKEQQAARGHVPASRDVLRLEIAETGELVRLAVRGASGIQIEFEFADWKFDPAIPDSSFRFQPPPGVAIVNGELPVPDSGVNH